MASEDTVEAFLAREQEQLAGIIDDEFGALTTSDTAPAPAPVNGFDGLNEPVLDLELEKPAENIFENEKTLVNGTHLVAEEEAPPAAAPVTLSALPLHQQAAMRRVATPTPPPTREEPAKIKNWREQQKERLEKKDANEEQEKKKMRDQAKRDLDDWYKKRNEQLEKTAKRNRSLEQESASDRESAAPGQEWERVVKLCEFNPKYSRATKDLTRFRSILVQMKNQPQKDGK